jgi:molecular chaperone DnaK
MPQIQVTFDIDANGIINVHAKDLGTGREQSVKVTATTNLNPADIDRMVREAEEHAAADAQAREAAEERNRAEMLAYSTEKTVKDAADKISETDRKTVQDALNQLREALKGNDIDGVRSAREHLEQAWAPVASAMYSQPAAEGQPAESGTATSAESGTGSSPDDVVDAEFRSSEEA